MNTPLEINFGKRYIQIYPPEGEEIQIYTHDPEFDQEVTIYIHKGEVKKIVEFLNKYIKKE